MEERKYAILYKVQSLSDTYKSFLLVPCKMVEGNYDGENDLFYTSTGEFFYNFEGLDFLPDENKYCVSMPISEEVLKKTYNEDDLNKAKNIYIDDMLEYAIMMNYNSIEDFYEISHICIKDIDEEELDEELDEEMELPEESNTKNDLETSEDLIKYYRKSLGLKDDELISIFSLEELERMLVINDIEIMIQVLNEIRDNKEDYLGKLNKKEIDTFVIADKELNVLIKDSNLDKIHEYLENLYRSYLHNKSIIEQENLKKFEPEEEIDIEKYNYNSLMKDIEERLDIVLKCNNFEKIKYVLGTFKRFYVYSLDNLYEDDKYKMTSTKRYLNTVIETISDLLFLNDLEEIKKYYIIMHYELEDLYRESVVEMLEANYDEYYMNAYNEKQKYYEEFFSNLKDDSYIINYKEVREQLVSRIIGRNSQIDTILTVIDDNDKLSNPSKKKSIIIAGSTGTGKTQTFLELKRILADVRPVHITDTNQITQVGYVGGSIEDNILLPLIMEAHEINNRKNNVFSNTITKEDIELAQHGIVFLDEIDKRATKGNGETNVNENGVIIQLLKLMDPGTKYSVKIGNKDVQFDTTNLIVLSGGAFQEYFDKVRESKPALGFVATQNTNTDKTTELFKYNEVDSEVLVKYGLDRQYIARHSKAVLYPPHTKESLVELENNVNTSNLQVLQDKYSHDGITFLWEDGYIEKVAEEAVKTGNGGRALVNIIERSLGNLSSEVKKRNKDFKAILIPVSAVTDSGTIVLVKKDDSITTLGELVEETRLEDEKSKRITQITKDEDMYKQVMKLYEKSKVKTLGEMPKN